MTSRRASTPVLVVGGGPVGLSTAIGLRHLGIDCTLVERHASTLDFPRGRGISVRTMEIFRQWGLEQRVVDAGLPRGESVFVFSGTSLLGPEFNRVGLPPDAAPPSPTERLICDQVAMEAVLRQHAEDVGVDLRYGTALSSLTDDADGVRAGLTEASGATSTLRAEWVVAADGVRSPLRAQLGIRRSGPGTVSRAMSLQFRAELGERMAGRSAAMYRIADLPNGSVLAVDNRSRWLLIYVYEPAGDSQESLTDERCLELARIAVGDPDVTVELLGKRFWDSTVLVADRYRIGRIVLAGDAAHVVTPIGGLGMNCGVADANNLAWKLAGVLHGWADESLLDTYEAERRPVAVATGEASLGASRPPAPTRGIDLGYAYTSAAVLPDGTPAPAELANPVGDYVPSGRPGSRAPHVWLDATTARSTLDAFGRSFVLLTDQVGSTAADRTTDGGIPVQRLVADVDGWQDAYGVEAGGGVLVRPDGHVAWRSSGPLDPSGADVAGALLATVGLAPA
jgi:2-polyprenyl-6-methoxyphenol hydroxylase-like FAD-dependent oxidoreductase